MLSALSSLGLTLAPDGDAGGEAPSRLLARIAKGDLDPRAAALIASHQHRRTHQRAAASALKASTAATPAMGELPLEGGSTTPVAARAQ